MKPLISVVTCTYNSNQFVEDAILSLNSQSYENFEHIVQDGGSTDGTIDIIQSFAQKYKNMSFESKKDSGIYCGFNNAIKRCKGDFICFLHSDDRFYDNRALESQVNIASKLDADIVFGDLVYTKPGSDKIIRAWRTKNFIQRSQYGIWVPPHTTMLVRRTLLANVEFDERYKISADFDWSIRLLRQPNVNVVHNSKFIMMMRTGGASTAGFSSEFAKFKEDFSVLRKNNIHWSLLFAKKLTKIPQFLKW